MENRKDVSRRNVWKKGEDAACKLLTRWGWKVLAKNWHSIRGEIDIIAIDSSQDVVAVEVKARSSGTWDSDRAATLVSPWKIVKVCRCLADFLACHPGLLYHRQRVDAICLVNGATYYFRGINDEWN
ncbi:YraN family protein [Parasphaerochaeta coccoides]|uniref:UPF0102 protein Spico_0515 n=1 Tax=Parasphaerochaeta coccoides (strain ATCC BAA-1237 / DSM 17374 / SPN1) TaxID=760011 RepID=F4GJA3_PARC1|nr:YraN family protein [Parasphaerochaeta coccoides]AEC01743.1 UPF0102 protein yraN [Parasphaerochaeta coccoides DSM 17374]